MKAITLLAVFGLVSTGIVPIGAKGETWLQNVWNLDNFFLKNLKFRIRDMLFYSGHFVIENQGNYAKD